jgi:ADP-ribosylglycohydrolase
LGRDSGSIGAGGGGIGSAFLVLVASGIGMTDAVLGCLLGTAVGDAMGLPYEGLPRRRIPVGILGHGWFLGRGMTSDDTEHTWIVVEALFAARGDVAVFERELGRGLRRWFLTMPPALGWATLRACLKLVLVLVRAGPGCFRRGMGRRCGVR